MAWQPVAPAARRRGSPAGQCSRGAARRSAWRVSCSISSGPAGGDHRPPCLLARGIRGLVGEVHAAAVGGALINAPRILQVVIVVAGLLAGLLMLALLHGLVLVVDGLLPLASLVIGLQQLILVGEPRDFGRIRFIDVDVR